MSGAPTPLDPWTGPLAQAASRLLFWGLVVGVSALMLLPHPPPKANLGWDKLNHVAAFAAVAWAGGLTVWTRTRATWPDGRFWWRLGASLLAWGAAIEVLQHWLPPRSADPADWLADAVGVLVGVGLWTAARALAIRIRAR